VRLTKGVALAAVLVAIAAVAACCLLLLLHLLLLDQDGHAQPNDADLFSTIERFLQD
jgi:hypothetical protein